MADQLTGAASGATGQGLGGLSGALQGGVNDVLSNGKGMLDRFFPPEKREALWAKITKFATEKPMLASFLLSQIALSGMPLALFAVMTVGVLVFALVAGLVIAVVGAVLFTVVAVGFALIILLPVLFMTTFAAAFIWLWGLGAYYIIKKFNDKPVPGIHTGVGEGLMDQSGIAEDLPNLNGNGEAKGPRQYDTGDEQKENHPPEKQANGGPNEKHVNGGPNEKLVNGGPNEKHVNGGPPEKKTPAKNPNAVKSTGDAVTKKADVSKKLDVGHANKTVDGVKGNVPGGLA